MDKKEKTNLLVFGYGLAIIVSLVVLRLAFKHHALSPGKMCALTAAAVLAMITAIRVETIKPFYKGWMKVARLIGEVVNFVLLTVIFYIFFSIPALILKLLRKDLLDEKIDKNAVSYWKTRPAGGFDRDSLRNQY